jgi:hypothetical protein
MEELRSEVEVLRAPANFILVGCTSSGKTSWLFSLLKEWPFEGRLGKIVYMYGEWQPLFDEMMRRWPNGGITFVQGLNESMIEDAATWSNEPGTFDVLVSDDLFEKSVNSEIFSRQLTCWGHHRNVINVFVTQNLYQSGKYGRTLARNCHFYVLFKTPHLNTLSTIGSQLYGKDGPLRAAFDSVMKERPYAYLLVDVFNDDAANRLRSNVFKHEFPITIYR